MGLGCPLIFVLLREHFEGGDWNHGFERPEEKVGEKENVIYWFWERENWKNREMFKWDLWEILPHQHDGKLSSTSHKIFHRTYLSIVLETN